MLLDKIKKEFSKSNYIIKSKVNDGATSQAAMIIMDHSIMTNLRKLYS